MFCHKLYVTCSRCGHRNLPHNSYRKAIRMVLLCQVGPCRQCGKSLGSIELKETATVKRIRRELEAEGLLQKPQPFLPPPSRTEEDPAFYRAMEEEMGPGFARIFTEHPEFYFGMWPGRTEGRQT